MERPIPSNGSVPGVTGQAGRITKAPLQSARVPILLTGMCTRRYKSGELHYVAAMEIQATEGLRFNPHHGRKEGVSFGGIASRGEQRDAALPDRIFTRAPDFRDHCRIAVLCSTLSSQLWIRTSDLGSGGVLFPTP